MKKNFIKIFPLLLAAAMALGACGADATGSAAGVSEDPSSVIVAEVNGIPLYKDTYELHYKNIEKDLKRNNIVVTDEEISDMALDMLINPLVTEYKVKELGYYEITDERQAQVREYMQEAIDDYLINEYLGAEYTEEDLKAARASYQDEVMEMYFNGMTFEQITEIYLPYVAEEAAKKDIVGEIVPTEEQMKEYYDERIAYLKQLYDEAPYRYVLAALSGFKMIYVPGGVRRIRQALIPLNEEDKAREVLSRLNAGEITFGEAMAEYPDKSMPAGGYPVVAGDSNYAAEFTEAAIGLGGIGDVAGLIETEQGYCIIQYYADEPEGAVPFESAYDTLYEGAKNQLTAEAWAAIIDGWREEMNVIIFDQNL